MAQMAKRTSPSSQRILPKAANESHRHIQFKDDPAVRNELKHSSAELTLLERK
jgi:hypothetical protein